MENFALILHGHEMVKSKIIVQDEQHFNLIIPNEFKFRTNIDNIVSFAAIETRDTSNDKMDTTTSLSTAPT